jgi:hypothetical protein
MVQLVGCIHDIQSNEEIPLLEGNKAVREQRDCFCELLDEVLKNEMIEFVGEEWGRQLESFAEILSGEHRARYAEINTTPADLERMGIPLDYTLCHYSLDQKEDWHRLREQFMFDKVKEGRGNSKNILVICGFDHTERLAEKFRESQEEANVEDYRKRPWYRNDVFFPTACLHSC